MIDCTFKNYIDIAALFEKHGTFEVVDLYRDNKNEKLDDKNRMYIKRFCNLYM